MFSFEGLARFDGWLRIGFRLMYLNLLWVLVTVAGLGVLGFGPASFALAAYLDRWFRTGDEPPVAATFLACARERMGRSVVVGVAHLAAAAVIVTNLTHAGGWWVRALNLLALLLWAVSLAYVFPVLAALEPMSLRRTVVAALLVGLGSLHRTALAFAATAALGYLLVQFALPLAVAFGVALPAAAVSLVTRSAFTELARGPAPGAPAPPRTAPPAAPLHPAGSTRGRR